MHDNGYRNINQNTTVKKWIKERKIPVDKQTQEFKIKEKKPKHGWPYPRVQYTNCTNKLSLSHGTEIDNSR